MLNDDHLLIMPSDMGAVDRAAIASGIASTGLMRAAGEAVAATVLAHFPDATRAIVLCGPGNNGGDGYVAAAALARAGFDVAVFALGDPARLKGDAAWAFAMSDFAPQPLSEYTPQAGDVVIDALFGAGLSKEIEGDAAETIDRVTNAGIPVVSVDLPSGVSGESGQVLGAAFRAARTVTFFRRKPGHLLMPGRELCGVLTVADIGIPDRFAGVAGQDIFVNDPDLWRSHLPDATAQTHKYRRGHLAVFSGPSHATGAARLSAEAGFYAGAGLVTLATPGSALQVNANHLTAVMVKRINDASELADWIGDTRLQTFVLGPGFGDLDKARAYVECLRARNLVLDADGITAFAGHSDMLGTLFSDGDTRLVITPHAGEFARLFPDLADDDNQSKLEKARAAARRINGICVLKGADTVVASPDGRAAINANAPPWLATAGSGDVLAGIIGGLLAQSMPAYEAACAGVWLHGEAGNFAGAGLTAEDLGQNVPAARVVAASR